MESLEIIDNGSGIAKADLQYLCKLFWSVIHELNGFYFLLQVNRTVHPNYSPLRISIG